MSRNIPGVMRYDLLASQHKPTTPEGIAAAVRELARQGLRVRDIASALRLSIPAVLEILKEMNR